jgi:hypothetical protein
MIKFVGLKALGERCQRGLIELYGSGGTLEDIGSFSLLVR